MVTDFLMKMYAYARNPIPNVLSMETWEPPTDGAKHSLVTSTVFLLSPNNFEFKATNKEPIAYVMSVSFVLDLLPVNNRATGYQIQVMFEGDDCSSATAYSRVNGTDYPVCTTIQYGYKPSSNSTWLAVEPQATQIATTTKTPEQMQAEAEQSGWLSIWHEFSWWYPWYRLHVKININPRIRVGWITVSSLGNTEYFI